MPNQVTTSSRFDSQPQSESYGSSSKTKFSSERLESISGGSYYDMGTQSPQMQSSDWSSPNHVKQPAIDVKTISNRWETRSQLFSDDENPGSSNKPEPGILAEARSYLIFVYLQIVKVWLEFFDTLKLLSMNKEKLKKPEKLGKLEKLGEPQSYSGPDDETRDPLMIGTDQLWELNRLPSGHEIGVKIPNRDQNGELSNDQRATRLPHEYVQRILDNSIDRLSEHHTVFNKIMENPYIDYETDHHVDQSETEYAVHKLSTSSHSQHAIDDEDAIQLKSTSFKSTISEIKSFPQSSILENSIQQPPNANELTIMNAPQPDGDDDILLVRADDQPGDPLKASGEIAVTNWIADATKGIKLPSMADPDIGINNLAQNTLICLRENPIQDGAQETVIESSVGEVESNCSSYQSQPNKNRIFDASNAEDNDTANRVPSFNPFRSVVEAAEFASAPLCSERSHENEYSQCVLLADEMVKHDNPLKPLSVDHKPVETLIEPELNENSAINISNQSLPFDYLSVHSTILHSDQPTCSLEVSKSVQTNDCCCFNGHATYSECENQGPEQDYIRFGTSSACPLHKLTSVCWNCHEFHSLPIFSRDGKQSISNYNSLDTALAGHSALRDPTVNEQVDRCGKRVNCAGSYTIGELTECSAVEPSDSYGSDDLLPSCHISLEPSLITLHCEKPILRYSPETRTYSEGEYADSLNFGSDLEFSPCQPSSLSEDNSLHSNASVPLYELVSIATIPPSSHLQIDFDVATRDEESETSSQAEMVRPSSPYDSIEDDDLLEANHLYLAQPSSLKELLKRLNSSDRQNSYESDDHGIDVAGEDDPKDLTKIILGNRDGVSAALNSGLPPIFVNIVSTKDFPINMLLDLTTSEGRLASFLNADVPLPANELVRAGFSSSSILGRPRSAVFCFRCRIELDRLNNTLNAMALHKTFGEDCPFMLEVLVPQTHLDVDTGVNHEIVVNDLVVQTPGASATPTPSEIYKHYNTLQLSLAKVNDDSGESNEDLMKLAARIIRPLETPKNDFREFGVMSDSPKHPNMALESNRKETMKTYHNTHLVDPKAAITAGFFWSGRGDQMICFSCGIEHSDWTADTAPLKRHMVLSPKCTFLLSMYNQEYIDQTIANEPAYTPPPRQVKIESVPVRSVKPRNEVPLAANIRENSSLFFDDDPPTKRLVEKTWEVIEERIKYGEPDYTRECDLVKDLLEKEKALNEITAEPPEDPLRFVNRSSIEESDVNRIQPKRRAQVTDEGPKPKVSQRASNPNRHKEPEPLDLDPAVLVSSARCQICLDEPKEIMFVPCTHLATCTKCGLTQPQCPVCRRDVKGTVRVSI